MAFASGTLQRRCSSVGTPGRKAPGSRRAAGASYIRKNAFRSPAGDKPSSAASSSTVATVPDSFVKPGSQLEQLAAMTVLSIDTGDIQTIEKFAATGLITDATTNPLFGEHCQKSV